MKGLLQIALVLVFFVMAVCIWHYSSSYSRAIEKQESLTEYLNFLESKIDSIDSNIIVKEKEVSLIGHKNDSLNKKIKSLDRNVGKIKIVYNDKILNINDLGIDSTLILLSSFLSKEVDL